MRKSIFLFFITFAFLFESSAKRYVDMVYHEIIAKMLELSQKYPQFCKLFDVRKEYNSLISTHCGKSLCEYWYLQLTDFTLPSDKINTLPQVLYIGGIHGDEPLGPNIIINLAEYLLQKNEENEDITRIMKSRVLILLPMANPSGFDLRIREEKQGDDVYLDPNRDFPYNIKNSECLRTSSARTINHLFKKYLIQAAITFHGGQQVISYPWGAYNHIKSPQSGQEYAEECPDDKAFEDIANILSHEAAGNPSLLLKPYPTGKMTDTVYAVNGRMEDWAYAASWESKFSPDVISKCENSSDITPIDPLDTEYNFESVRTLIYLIETSDFKSPATNFLGSSDGLESSSDRYAYGLIPINIKLCLALADILEPYIKLKGVDYSEHESTLTVGWQGGGCKTVDSTVIEWKESQKDLSSSSRSNPMGGPGYYQDNSYIYKQIIPLSADDFNISLSIQLTCDQGWGVQVNPKPLIGPQTHIVQARLNQDYYAESNGYKITGKKVVALSMKNITKDYLLRTRITDVKDISLTIDFSDCSNHVYVGSVNLRVYESLGKLALQITGHLNIEDQFLEGHLHQYGDISRCTDSAGEKFNLFNLKSDPIFNNSWMFSLEKDQIKSVKVDNIFSIEKKEDILNLIGRSIVLEKKSHIDKVYIGQITPMQPPSCRKKNETRKCLGTDLGSEIGVCILNLQSADTLKDFKLFIEPNTDKKSVTISGLVPTSIIERYGRFQDLYIINEKTEKKFSIKQTIANFGLISRNLFELYPQIALGMTLQVAIQNIGEKLFIGECSIGLKDISFNETLVLMDNQIREQQEKASAIRGKFFLVVVVCLFFIFFSVIICIIKRRYQRIKQQNFKSMMSGRKERYADTARMISTARGVMSARASQRTGGPLSIREVPSARVGFPPFGSKSNNKPEMPQKPAHIELQENSIEESQEK